MTFPTVSIFQNALSNSPKNCSLTAILNAIKSGRYAIQIERLRTIRASDPALYDREKKNLPAFLVSGTASNRKTPVAHSNLIQGDLDKLNSTLDLVREKLKADPHVAFGFVSPSGDGIKFGIAIPGEHHTAAFLAAQIYFRERYGFEIDPSVKDRLRLCFVSCDADLWTNPDVTPIEVSADLIDAEKKKAEKPIVSEVVKDSRCEITQKLLGPIEWETDYHGFCHCPGERLHETTTNPKDCEVWLDKVPTIHCFHGHCEPMVNAANRELRSLIGKAEYVPNVPRRTLETNGEHIEHEPEPAFRQSNDEYYDTQTAAAEETPQPPPVKRLSELQMRTENDPSELIKHAYLCRGAGALWAGPTGIGKSVMEMQAAIVWANGLPFFGMQPARALKSLIIQAEDDEGDMAEFANGIVHGLNLNKTQILKADENVMICSEDSRVGLPLCTYTIEPLLVKFKPDILWLNPVNAYIGGSTKDQEIVGFFLRNLINPLIRKYGCAAIVVHHTNKPPAGKEKPDWQATDFAYLGSGSAEWANWPRAVLGIRAIGSHSIFELKAGKRGGRLRWQDDDGNPTHSKFIAHSENPNVLYWRSPDSSELDFLSVSTKSTDSDNPKTIGRPSKIDEIATSNLYEFCSECKPEGEGLNEISRRLEAHLAKNKKDISIATSKRIVVALVANGKLLKTENSTYLKGQNA